MLLHPRYRDTIVIGTPLPVDHGDNTMGSTDSRTVPLRAAWQDIASQLYVVTSTIPTDKCILYTGANILIVINTMSRFAPA